MISHGSGFVYGSSIGVVQKGSSPTCLVLLLWGLVLQGLSWALILWEQELSLHRLQSGPSSYLRLPACESVLSSGLARSEGCPGACSLKSWLSVPEGWLTLRWGCSQGRLLSEASEASGFMVGWTGSGLPELPYPPTLPQTSRGLLGSGPEGSAKVLLLHKHHGYEPLMGKQNFRIQGQSSL